ncbi:hypothetical protein Hamer_G018089 [Homarus americanus]|uniref:Uncharacterized protein n=1 Tax=Homarus americanus TaxID=6706 RepID=A0A8J5N7R4_HOMAM|nr:hypothetical protein Hamer_G018089 [Homarus americanus]
MLSLKSSGGLTHGSGMTEEMRALWTMSIPITSEYTNAMQEFNDLTYTTSEQHRESTEARMKRDHSDLEKIKEKLSTCMPFSPDPSLRNIITGLVAKEDVNVHEYETVGNEIIEKMVGKPVFGISFKRKDRQKPSHMSPPSNLPKAEPLILLCCSKDFWFCQKPETFHWKMQ